MVLQRFGVQQELKPGIRGRCGRHVDERLLKEGAVDARVFFVRHRRPGPGRPRHERHGCGGNACTTSRFVPSYRWTTLLNFVWHLCGASALGSTLSIVRFRARHTRSSGGASGSS